MSNPATLTAAPERIRGSLLNAPERVDLDAIAQHFVKLAGGPGAIGKMMYDEYAAAPEGSPVRARIMEMMLRAFTKLDAKAIPDDLSTVSDEDLQRVLGAMTSRITGETNGHFGPAAAAEEIKQGGREKEKASAAADPSITASADGDSSSADPPATD